MNTSELSSSRLVIETVDRITSQPEEAFEHEVDCPGCAIEVSRLRAELGWEPQFTNFEAGLADTISWYENNRSWWEPLKAEVEANYAKAGQ